MSFRSAGLPGSFTSGGISIWLQRVLMILVLGSGFSFSQTTVILNGYIKDSRSAETLIGANVYIQETLQGTTTNNSGYYTLADIVPGKYTLVASYIGYQDYRAETTIKAGEELRIDIELTSAAIAVEEQIVEAEATIDEEKPVGRLTIPAAQVKELPAILEADLFRSLQLLPGIKSSSDFSSGLYIRGGSPDQTLILLDRTTVYNPSHFFGFFSTFNPDAIKDVQVYKGGYPAEYGGRLGSVVDIYNRDGNRKKYQKRVTVGLLASRLNIEGPLPNGSWMFAGRRSTLEPLLAALRNTIDDVPDAFYFYDLNGKVNVDPNPNNRLNFSFYTGIDNVEFPFGEGAQFNLRYGNNTFSSNWTHVFSQKLFSNFTVTRSHYFNEPNININGTSFVRENQVTDVSAKGDFEFIPNSKHQLRVGFWAGDLELSVLDRFDNQETLNETIESTYASAYIQETWKPTRRWIFNGGVRSNYFKRGDYLRAEPRISIEHVYRPDLLFQVAYGRYYQFLTLITNEAFSGFDLWLTTAEGVRPAWGDQFIFGFKSRPTDNYTLDIEAYYRTMHDLFELEPSIQDVAGVDYADLFRFGEGYAYGIEFLLQKKRGRLQGFIGYTLGTSRRKFPEYNNNESYPPKYDRIHDLNLVLNYQLSNKWRFTSVFNYATGQAHTEVLGNYSLTTPTSSAEENPLIVGALNGSRLPAYQRLDIGFTREGRFFNWCDFELQLQVINLYSRRNIWFYNYTQEGNLLIREDVRMLPILPNISFSLTGDL